MIDVDGAVGGGLDVDGDDVVGGVTLPPSPPVHAAVSTAAAAITHGPARTSAPCGLVFEDEGWARLGSNQRPTDYESAALTD